MDAGCGVNITSYRKFEGGYVVMMLRLHMVDCDDLPPVLINSEHIVFIEDYLEYRLIALDIAVGILHKLYTYDVKEILGEIENMMNRKVY